MMNDEGDYTSFWWTMMTAPLVQVLGVVQEQIERALESQPTSFDQFRYKLSRLTYQEITQIWHQERRAKDQTGLQAKPILWVSSILSEMMSFVVPF